MRYLQGKEKSSELLRLALPLMARQSAGFHPMSYALWYEHVAGINPQLSQVLAQRLQTNTPLTDEEVYRLHARYVVERDLDALDRLQQKLHTLLDEAAHSTANAGAEANNFGQALEQRKAELAESIGSEDVRRVVAELVSETMRMKATTQALSQKLEASSQEVDSLTNQLEQAQTEALLDPLCGLKNRRGLKRAVEEIFNGTVNLENAALLVADVDHFKKVNDTYGHILGDKVICAIGQVLHANIKGRDIAARIGGEEFAVLLPRTTMEGAVALAEQLRAAVARGRIHRNDRKDHIGTVTMSVGVAVGVAGETFEELLQRADEAMYAAKNGGRNRVCVAAARAEGMEQRRTG